MTKRIGEPQQPPQRGAHKTLGQEGGLCSTPLQKYVPQDTQFVLAHRGFDGFDVSYRAHLPLALLKELEGAKAAASLDRTSKIILHNGIMLEVLGNGASGGYAFVAKTGIFGATWFFKKPVLADPWGIRVSANSFFLALQGLCGARAQIFETMKALGVNLSPDDESIGRVDFAIDFLAPNFALEPENFVMHSNTIRADYIEQSNMLVNGSSGSVSSVTIGKMPGRQIIVYNKRAEVIAKRKAGWWTIWEENLGRDGLASLERDDPTKSTVWRVEIRAGKSHLKKTWGITSWDQLTSIFPNLVSEALSAIRYTSPSFDTNRSRWPDSHLWLAVRRATAEGYFQSASCCPSDRVKEVELDAHSRMLLRQITGTLVTRAGASGLSSADLESYAERCGREAATEICKRKHHFAQKLARARARYGIAPS